MLTRWPYEARGGTLARNSMTAQQGRQVTHARRAFRDGGGDGNESERRWTWVFGMADSLHGGWLWRNEGTVSCLVFLRPSWPSSPCSDRRTSVNPG